MKYQTTAAFDADYRSRLSDDDRKLFRQVLRDDFIPAAEEHARHPGGRWPKSLRVKSVEGARGVWEMTWSFTGPDGRATFEWVEIDGDRGIRWRRIGRHSIFSDP